MGFDNFTTSMSGIAFLWHPVTPNDDEDNVGQDAFGDTCFGLYIEDGGTIVVNWRGNKRIAESAGLALYWDDKPLFWENMELQWGVTRTSAPIKVPSFF